MILVTVGCCQWLLVVWLPGLGYDAHQELTGQWVDWRQFTLNSPLVAFGPDGLGAEFLSKSVSVGRAE